ncbi:MAG: hypothetical protein JW717_13320 [Marinilabiliaceae bacterium]|nr:hypothetical protein [Marinilabiliaceae bacterium]
MTEQILLNTLPLIILSIVVLLIVRLFSKQMIYQLRLNHFKDDKKQIISLKLQSLERLTLFIERISPQSLIIREQKQSLNCQQFHSLLIQSIRKEYEHNLSVQIYVTSNTWQAIVNAKEDILRLINTCASESQPKNPSIELAQKILERSGSSVSSHIERAKTMLRNEINEMSK